MSERLRVLHVIPSVARQHGGPSRAMALIERSLADSDIDCEVATTDDDGPGRRLAGRFGRDGWPADAAGASTRRRFFAKRSEFYKVSPALALWLWRHVRDYDVVHIHALFSFSSVAAAWIARRAGVPYVVRPLGTLNQYGVTQRRPWLKRWSLHWIEGPILRHAAAVHFTAESERLEAEDLLIPMRDVVIPLAVDNAEEPDQAELLAKLPALASRRYAVTVSRIDRVKNIESLLEAFAQLGERHADVLLVVAGDGDAGYLASLKQQAQALGIGERVVWAGFVDGAIKSALLHGASVFVLPSYSENFGIAAAEALAAGLPCVLGKGVAIAGAAEAAGAGAAIDPDAGSIAAALARYLSMDERDGRATRDAARAFARDHFSLAAMGERLRSLYRSIAGSGGQ